MPITNKKSSQKSELYSPIIYGSSYAPVPDTDLFEGASETTGRAPRASPTYWWLILPLELT